MTGTEFFIISVGATIISLSIIGLLGSDIMRLEIEVRHLQRRVKNLEEESLFHKPKRLVDDRSPANREQIENAWQQMLDELRDIDL